MPSSSATLSSYDAKEGYCQVDCQRSFFALLALLFVMAFLAATARMPNTLLMIRVINPKDKSASVSLLLVVSGSS